MNFFRAQAVALLLVLTGLGDPFCVSAFAQEGRVELPVRVQWIDPERKFGGLGPQKQAIEMAMAREISKHATLVYRTLYGASAALPIAPDAEWFVKLSVEPWVLTSKGEPQTWWRVDLVLEFIVGDVSNRITGSDNQVLYDFYNFPPFADALTLSSDLVSRVYEQIISFGQAGEASVVGETDASSAGSQYDPANVIRSIQTYIETDDLSSVELARQLHEKQTAETEVDALSNSHLVSTLKYHIALGGLYTHLSVWGDATKARQAVHQLEQARRMSYLLEDRLGGETLSGEMPDVYRLNREISSLLNLACEAGGTCGPPNQPRPPPPVTKEYTGDDIRLAIGYKSETDLTGEFFWNVFENTESAFSFEGWKGTESAGGMKLNFHWLAGGQQLGADIEDKPLYVDGRVRKLFIASDWNVFNDGKLSFGGGSERRDRFWSAYASKSITGERFLRSSVTTETLISNGKTDDHHPWIQTDTTLTTTKYLAHPYDWGLGFRIGRHFNSRLLRLRGGLDYEFGEYSSSQITASIGLDKRFEGTGHGLSLGVEVYRKQGDFESDQHDVRFSLFWSWDFGKTFRRSGTIPEKCSFELPTREDAYLEAAWILRALRNPVAHKRSVDYYRHNQVTELHESEFELINEGPLAVDDNYDVKKNSQENALDVLANDSDPDGDPIGITHAGKPIFGSTSFDHTIIRYSPAPGFCGTDTFSYEISDGQGSNDSALVTVAVINAPPFARDDHAQTFKNTPVVIEVLTNDSDPDGDPITIQDIILNANTKGTVEDNGNGTLTYTPTPGWWGGGSFQYTIVDDCGETSTATVTVAVDRAG